MSDMTPEQRRLAAKYGTHSGPGYGVQDVTPQQAVATAWAEQVERTIREMHAACEAYNGDELGWLLWELPTELRQRVEQARARVAEGRRRGIVHYYDDRNKYDEANGWPAFDPDNPDHATVPLGTVLADHDTVHVLRGGTQPLFDRRDGLGRHQRASEVEPPNSGLPDYGHAYDFATFMKTAERTYTFGFCDLRSAAAGWVRCFLQRGGRETAPTRRATRPTRLRPRHVRWLPGCARGVLAAGPPAQGGRDRAVSPPSSCVGRCGRPR